jgi:hypothetical protein
MGNMLKEPASFRDPSGFIFRGSDATLYRQVNRSYKVNYRRLMDSGLYQELVAHKLLIEHEEAPLPEAVNHDAYRVIRPRELGFISYPYEWSFGALKRAALLTLEIQQRALKAGMSLKDASSYNVQFEGIRPVFIDTLSFESYESGMPWKAYGQFCRHFLAPLALMAKTNVGLNRLLLLHIDGVPLDLASQLLPWRARLHPGLFVHLHLHAKLVQQCGNTSKRVGSSGEAKKRRISFQGLTALLENLRKIISRLTWNPTGTDWAEYYENNSYSSLAFEEKRQTVRRFLDRIRPPTVWDLGANTGVFSRIASRTGAKTYAFDIDPACCEINFQVCDREGEQNLLPLFLDLTNPSPAIGWAHRERQSFTDRGPADVAMALALIHHLTIANNVPFHQLAEFFHRLCRHLIIEFVPKDDPQVIRLLRSREDVFEDYSQAAFETAFKRRFVVIESHAVGDDGRVIYLMQAADLLSAQ